MNPDLLGWVVSNSVSVVVPGASIRAISVRLPRAFGAAGVFTWRVFLPFRTTFLEQVNGFNGVVSEVDDALTAELVLITWICPGTVRRT